MYKRYEEYKDSGVEWIGEIPEHWNISKVNYFYDICLGKMLQNSPLLATDTLEKYLCAVNVLWDEVQTSSLKEMWFSEKEKIKYNLKKGDLIVCEGGEAGRASLWNGSINKCYIQNAVHRIRHRYNSLNKYLYYWLFSAKKIGYIDLICNKATIAHLTREKLANLELAIPELDSQIEIVNFLDNKTSEISSLIADKEKLIKRLEEYKQSIITEAVTKGLNPDVKMKDSGIEWIGEIPEHWEVKRLKDFSNIARGTVDKSIKEDEIPVYLVQYTNVYYKREQKENDEDYLLVTVTNNEWQNSNLLKGDILVTASSETPDDIGRSTVIVDELDNHVFGSDVLRIRVPDFTMVLNYKKHLIDNYKYLQKINSLCRGVTRFRFGMNDFKTIRYLIPPINEQVEIADYLDNKFDMIESLKKDTNNQIQNLKTYRQSLIFEAVTGKIDVRDNQSERSEQFA